MFRLPFLLEEALDEGVIAMCSLGPEAVLTEDDKVVGMRMRECLSVFDSAGRFAPEFGEGLIFYHIECLVY